MAQVTFVNGIESVLGAYVAVKQTALHLCMRLGKKSVSPALFLL